MRKLSQYIDEGFFNNVVGENAIYDAYVEDIITAVDKVENDKEFDAIDKMVKDYQARHYRDGDRDGYKYKMEILSRKKKLDKKYEHMLDIINVGTKISIWSPTYRIGYIKTTPHTCISGRTYEWSVYTYRAHLMNSDETDTPWNSTAEIIRHMSGYLKKSERRNVKIKIGDSYETTL